MKSPKLPQGSPSIGTSGKGLGGMLPVLLGIAALGLVLLAGGTALGQHPGGPPHPPEELPDPFSGGGPNTGGGPDTTGGILLPNTVWVGQENVFGNWTGLTFQFNSGGQVTMKDAHHTYQGTYTQIGYSVSINVPQANTTFQGLIQVTNSGKKLLGTGKTNNGHQFQFQVNLSTNAFAPAPGQHHVAAGLANSTWKGHENLNGPWTQITFQFLPGGQVKMTDTQQTYYGSYSQHGGQVIIQLPSISTTFTGNLSGSTLQGQGHDNNGAPWNFSVHKN